MIQSSFSRRFLLPAGTLLLIMASSLVAYKMAWQIEQPFWHAAVSHVFGILFFLCLGFGALYVYQLAYHFGSGPGERILCSLVNPFIWSTKEVLVLTGIYTIGEAAYFYLNPVNVLLYSAVLAEIGLAEMLCRRRRKRLGERIGALSFPALLALLLGLASVVFVFAWDLGVNHFYYFQEGFKALFGYGVGI